MANGGGPFGIGNQILKGFIGNDTLRDYTHASKTFTSNSYELKPRYKFLYHVSFTINTNEIPYLRGVFGNNESAKLSLLVKTIDLPKFQIATETLNQYNRKRIIQKKIDYQPVNLVFHDDGGDNARRLWYYYYSYYYKDPTQQYLAPNNTNGSVGASQNRHANNTGGKPPFFSDIRIYGLDQRKFAEYVLINPVIQSWSHDTYDYSQGGGTMQHSVTIAYETVKYYSGAVGASRPDTNVEGFADPSHYDTTLSPISRPGGNSTIFGQGGLLEAGVGILGDLQSGGPGGLIGAAQKAMRVANTFKGKNLASLAKNEALSLGVNQIIQAIPGATRQVMNRAGGVFIPTPQKTPQSASPPFNPNEP